MSSISVAILADQERLDVLVDRRGDGQRALAVRGAADPVEPGSLVSTFTTTRCSPPGCGEDRLDVGDLQGRPAAPGGLLRPDGRFGQGQRGRGQARELPTRSAASVRIDSCSVRSPSWSARGLGRFERLSVLIGAPAASLVGRVPL